MGDVLGLLRCPLFPLWLLLLLLCVLLVWLLLCLAWHPLSGGPMRVGEAER